MVALSLRGEAGADAELSTTAEIPAPECSLSSVIAASLFVPQQPDLLSCAVGKITRLVTLLGILDCHNLNYVAGIKDLEGLNVRINYCYISVLSIIKKKNNQNSKFVLLQ